jgi:hypothetical protein
MTFISDEDLGNYACLQISLQKNTHISVYLDMLSRFGSDARTVVRNISHLLNEDPELNERYQNRYRREEERQRRNGEKVDRMYAALPPEEKKAVCGFLDALKKQDSAHEFQVFWDPDYVKELCIYLQTKASAELKGELFEDDSDLEMHIAGCESCQAFYGIAKQAAPILDRIEGAIE